MFIYELSWQNKIFRHIELSEGNVDANQGKICI